MENQTAIVASSHRLKPETPFKADDANFDRFKKSLQELKHLRSQLHHAADQFQAAACRNLNGASQRKLVLESTRKYICEAIVTVVDHLGCVSYELENNIQVKMEVSEIEQRINCFEQRNLTCQQYALAIDLSNLRWDFKFPRHHQHYIISPSTQHHYNLNGGLRKDQPTITVRSPMFHASNSLREAVPLPLTASIFSKPSNSSVTSNAKGLNIIQDGDLKKKAVHGGAFLSFLRFSQTKTNSSRR